MWIEQYEDSVEERKFVKTIDIFRIIFYLLWMLIILLLVKCM